MPLPKDMNYLMDLKYDHFSIQKKNGSILDTNGANNILLTKPTLALQWSVHSFNQTTKKRRIGLI